ncbi:putative colanic acid biosynthesis acetyltransferase [Limnobacter parvus]|uniref:Colanic acid biosynthesis acetyltransferase n=1 Tax=Limnobacter parvus TaxID=2939690 RepID=A0ABT1XD61_9BURK|nr:putative colanic acid biosynthesis acetyltransferase [Limnobacter parvus]MCR2745211.1 putative colanic acid biosynthesis acetyltransferase [Limnobacter parvus]
MGLSDNYHVKRLSLKNKIARLLWYFVSSTFFRLSPIPLHGWRRFILRLFGASVGSGAHPYPSANIWAPWNLIMEENSCLSHGVNCYNVATVSLGKNVTVSQFCHLCTATHDYTDLQMPLLVASIRIDDYAWVTADVFVGPGVVIGEGAVVNARSCVFSDIDPWTVARGYPAKSYRKRILKGVKD